ncbi:alpha/beta fold hydrolase [Pseudomonas sp. MYb118]|uniref:alpha/beta fold hydrolase n=1 Tax=Pseudomonas sp. MYb118 TaxID=1848720 RepID=UPI0034CD9ADF
MVTRGYYPTDDGHQLYWERWGTPGGEPVFFLHGGPGGCSNRHHLEFFDEQHFEIILFDQRGCGRSLPHGERQLNDTGRCVEDIDGLRLHLGFARISLLGVSWGSWLAIQYQQRYPEAVLKTTLASIFVPFAENVSAYDDNFTKGLSAIHDGNCAGSAEAIYEILDKGCALRQRQAALHWLRASLYLSGQSMSPDALGNFVDQEAVRAIRLELHYHVNRYFFTRAHERLSLDANTQVIQGTRDLFGMSSVRWLRRRLPLQFRLFQAGHNAFEPAILKAVRQALKRAIVH